MKNTNTNKIARTTVIIPSELMEEVKEELKKKRLSFNSLVCILLRKWLKEKDI